MWQYSDTTWWQTFEPSNASDATSRPNVESICKMHVQTNYKSDLKKYRKSEFGTNASGAIWWPNLQLIQVTESISGSVVPLAMFLKESVPKN